jgi:hypothetical protein
MGRRPVLLILRGIHTSVFGILHVDRVVIPVVLVRMHPRRDLDLIEALLREHEVGDRIHGWIEDHDVASRQVPAVAGIVRIDEDDVAAPVSCDVALYEDLDHESTTVPVAPSLVRVMTMLPEPSVEN